MEVDTKFYEGVRRWNLADEYAGILARYLLHGLHPGSGFESFIANDLHNFLGRSHPANSLPELKKLTGWMYDVFPYQARGSYDAVKDWCKMTQEERDQILQDRGTVMTPWEVLQSPKPRCTVIW